MDKPLSPREEVKLNRRLVDATTAQIVTHLLFRHRVFLLALALALSWTFKIVTQLPHAWASFVR